MDTDFLNDVQRKGWSIVRADKDTVTVRCRARGCNMGAQLTPSGPVPAVLRPDEGVREIPVEVFEQIRVVLKARREALGLTIPELEDVVGMARDQIAKCERENSTKIPNVQTIMEWATALGFRFALLPCNLPAITLRYIETTRDMTNQRKLNAARRDQR